MTRLSDAWLRAVTGHGETLHVNLEHRLDGTRHGAELMIDDCH